jgi:hypothetical protein
MTGHEKSCMCDACLNRLADIVDELATLAIDMQIKAAWRGWNLDEQPQWAGHDWSLPTVPQQSWHAWFEMQDRPRRELVLAQVTLLLEAEQLRRR